MSLGFGITQVPQCVQPLINSICNSLSCLLTARFILQLREIQYGLDVVLDADGVAQEGDNVQSDGNTAATLSAMHAATRRSANTSTFDSVIMRDFGDGPIIAGKGKEREEWLVASSESSGIGGSSQTIHTSQSAVTHRSGQGSEHAEDVSVV